jgi:pimeloyl-ACP methyl ester carboxylesterase
MPFLRRPGEVEIHWEERGEGPPVLLLPHCMAPPQVYRGLCEELARDHRVVTYDARGAGKSSREGPYDLATDVEDLTALLRDLGGDAVAVGLGDGRDRAVRVARSDPSLVCAVVGCDGSPAGAFMRERLDATMEYSTHEAIHARAQWYVREDVVEAARAIGDRLWIAFWESDWTPPRVLSRVRQLLPAAHVRQVEGGPISRPDVVADVVREAAVQRASTTA